MATARKLPSGSWRVRVYDSETKTYKSFTSKNPGKAGKKEAEMMAQMYLNGKEKKPLTEKTLGECIDDYIALKENILSPTTIDKYKNIKRNQLDKTFLSMGLSKINGVTVQSEVNRLAGKYSPKTVHNAHGLISAVLRTYYPDLQYKITLPQKQYKNYPTAEEIIRMFKGTDIELAVLLGMWQGFRISEIRGLKKSDFVDGNLIINRVKVDVGNDTVIKDTPKTADSRRKMAVPPIIQSMVDKLDTEYITELNRKGIYQRFKRIVKKNGYPDITFHDLRHINASVMLALNVPDKYAMERGGWSTTSTLKRVYQETFSDERQKIDERIDKYFEDIYDTKDDTKNKSSCKYRIIRHIKRGSNPR